MRTLALTAALLLTTAALAAAKGPPHLTIELRPSGTPSIIVRTFHHGTPMPMPLAGTAEGLVGGRRVSVAVRFDAIDSANAFAPVQTWGSAGVWVLNITLDAGDHGRAGGVVGIDRRGTPVWSQYPAQAGGGTRPASAREIDALLAALDADRTPPRLATGGFLSLVWFFRGPLTTIAALIAGLAATGAVARRAFRPSAQPAL